MKNLYTIFDVVAKEAGPIWIGNNHETAVRNVSAMFLRDKVTKPEDLHLYCIGTFDPETMEILPERTFISLNSVFS